MRTCRSTPSGNHRIVSEITYCIPSCVLAYDDEPMLVREVQRRLLRIVPDERIPSIAEIRIAVM